MSNEYIEVVKRWLADKDSVSHEELRANARAAYAAAAAAEADATAAARAADAADAADADGADNVDYWVKRYEELTNNGSF